ncbi:MAG: polysaccharide deacetylase family protein, partial [Chitinophagaceae bacterium]
GGHTLHHKRLHNTDSGFLQTEIEGSFLWLQQLLGKTPVSFCFPGGVYTKAAIAAAFQYGYKVVRTTELLSTSTAHDGELMPTTLQLYEHSSLTYVKHLLKRQKWISLSKFLRAPFKINLQQLTHYYLDTLETGDCFHLWGHSWELEEQGLWQKLEAVLSIISNRPDFTYITNGQIPTATTATNY